MKLKRILASRRLHVLLGIAVSAGLLIYVASTVKWGEVLFHLRHAHLWVLIPALAVFGVHYALRAYRWRFLLPPEKPAEFGALFDALMVGNFATYVLPLRAGEFVRPFLLSRYSSFSFSSCFVSVVVERFFDLSMVLAAFAVVVRYIPGLPDWTHQGVIALSTLALGIFVFMLTSALAPRLITRLIEYLSGFLPAAIRPGVHRFLTDFMRGAQVLHNPLNLTRIVLLSLLVWGSCFVLFYVFCLFFDIPPSIWIAVTVTVIIALAVAAPSAPGFLGVYQTACLAGFQLFGISAELAVAYSILTHALHFALFMSYGSFALFRRNLRLADLTQRSTS
ncbi:MAG: flippase-like domain-containing protein [Oligoflexia bacterium]|nr:flippase-like domain-containing protein [Oligoflexia bacterium]